MSTFRFNFLVEEENFEDETLDIEDKPQELSFEVVRIVIQPQQAPPNKHINKLQFGEHFLYRLDDEDNTSNYDLIPGTYEGKTIKNKWFFDEHTVGGRKIWECSIDLVEYIYETLGNNQEVKSVLELGCGHGLPGVVAGKCGYNPIVFSDFNDDVLESLTWPTITLNIPHEIYSSPVNVGCLAGDWCQLSHSLLQGLLPYPSTYDLILSAETLYNLEAVHKVFKFLALHLSTNGFALLASKRYYFGVGGGVHDFLGLACQPSSNLHAEVVKVFDDGKSNIREIIRVTRKH